MPVEESKKHPVYKDQVREDDETNNSRRAADNTTSESSEQQAEEEKKEAAGTIAIEAQRKQAPVVAENTGYQGNGSIDHDGLTYKDQARAARLTGQALSSPSPEEVSPGAQQQYNGPTYKNQMQAVSANTATSEISSINGAAGMIGQASASLQEVIIPGPRQQRNVPTYKDQVQVLSANNTTNEISRNVDAGMIGQASASAPERIIPGAQQQRNVPTYKDQVQALSANKTASKGSSNVASGTADQAEGASPVAAFPGAQQQFNGPTYKNQMQVVSADNTASEISSNVASGTSGLASASPPVAAFPEAQQQFNRPTYKNQMQAISANNTTSAFETNIDVEADGGLQRQREREESFDDNDHDQGYHNLPNIVSPSQNAVIRAALPNEEKPTTGLHVEAQVYDVNRYSLVYAQPIIEEESKQQAGARNWRKLICIIGAFLVVILGALLGWLIPKNNTKNVDNNTNDGNIGPTTTPTEPKAFESLDELKAAVDMYVFALNRNNSEDEDSQILLEYGENITTWTVLSSLVTDFSLLFSPFRNTELASFSGINAVENWEVGHVTDMSRLCYGFALSTDDPPSYYTPVDSSFNANLGNWSTANVTNMRLMFGLANSFQGNGVENWNVERVTDMGAMFWEAHSFQNANLGNWNTSKLRYAIGMFENAWSFTGEGLQNWDVSNLQNYTSMFCNASSFDPTYIADWPFKDDPELFLCDNYEYYE